MNGNLLTTSRPWPSMGSQHQRSASNPLAFATDNTMMTLKAPLQANLDPKAPRDVFARDLSELKTALEQHAIMATIDAQGKFTYVSDLFCALFKYSREELVGKNYWFAGSENQDQSLLANVWASLGQGNVWRGEVLNRAKDGTSLWMAATIIPLLDAEGKYGRSVALLTDITERKLAEEALARSLAEVRELKERLRAEKDFDDSEMQTTHQHGEIIGRSEGIKRVLCQVEQVAPADCAVLITGETGTGKELIAQEIHRLSRRKAKAMVMVNCAALPSALVESELFGRERGAYTGALTSQVGRFQVANDSTVFLDEVGELSTEAQAKLLRVLEQGEFQRLGSPNTIKVNVRVIAATNRDLGEDVRKGKFREDLYYRLNVFPISLPPLRERVEDIPMMVFAFVEEISRRIGKKITKISCRSMEALQKHSWPGNIRELRNVIEHSIILSGGDTLKLSFLSESPTKEQQPVTLAQAEREHILKTLETTHWRIKGRHGASERLDMEPSTLYSRMQKLGIPNRRQKEEQEA